MIITGSGQRGRLKELLFKLGIKSAAKGSIFEDMLRYVAASSGRPDQMLMSPASLEAYIKTFNIKK